MTPLQQADRRAINRRDVIPGHPHSAFITRRQSFFFSLEDILLRATGKTRKPLCAESKEIRRKSQLSIGIVCRLIVYHTGSMLASAKHRISPAAQLVLVYYFIRD